jgi:4-amino-4-deoxy-L-arabinose transferase-like glycosyltransferase
LPTLTPTRRTWAVMLALAALAIFMRALPGPRTIDDAFITFRYSRNLVEGQGFVYNPGVHTLGTTTPLFTLVMAAVSAVTGREDFPWYAIAVSALADAATAALLYRLARRLTGEDFIAALPGLLWAVSPRSVTFAIGGMETSVAVLWMVGAAWWYVNAEMGRGRGVLIGLFAALGFLTRIDSLIWIGPLFAFQLVDSWRARRGKPPLKRLPWATWLTFALALLPWLAFSATYFGALIPNSLSAKTVAYIMPPGTALINFIQNGATPFFEDELFGPYFIAVGGLLYLALSGIGLLYAGKRQPRLLPLLIYPWLYMAVFSVANPLIFRWYLLPPVPGLILGIFAGLWAILSGLRERPQLRRAVPVAFAALGAFWVITSLAGWELHPDHGPDRPAPKMAWHKIELLYQQIGTELRDQYGVTPATLVASGDIGAVGYFSRATIIDTVGLVTPAMRQYYPVSPDLIAPGQNYAIPPRLILDTQPQYLVAMESMVRLGLEKDATFQAEYQRIQDIPTDFYGTGMYLYQRKAGS